MSNQHTPGLWTIGHPNIRGPHYVMVGGHTVIADVPSTVGEQSHYVVTELAERAANARLIAAAPDLLEAIETLLEAIEGNHVTVGDCNQARAAIQKATA